MAKDYLSMMPKSVVSMRAFSSGGLTITNTRANLNPNIANESICLFSLLKTFNEKKFSKNLNVNFNQFSILHFTIKWINNENK